MEWWEWLLAGVAAQPVGALMWFLLKAPERRLRVADVDGEDQRELRPTG